MEEDDGFSVMSEPIQTLAALLARCGFIGVFGAFYACACIVLLHRLTDRAANMGIIAAIGALAFAVFLLDRVKPADRFHDPADAQAHPARHAFVWSRRRALRVVVILLAAGSSVLLLSTAPLLALLVPLAIGGVLVYGTLPKRPRPKDILILKNLAVAGSITALSMAVLIANRGPTSDGLEMNFPLLIATAAVLLLQVFLDAMLCDLDDVAADAAFGTQTIPVNFGAERTWAIAAVLQCVVIVSIVAISRWMNLPKLWMASCSILLMTSFVVLWARRHRPVRDAVDLRLPLVVGFSELIVLAGGFNT